MSDFYCFGTPSQFEIAASWSEDLEPRARLPLKEGWSTGRLRITVGYQVLTEHYFNGELHNSLCWYLSPVIEWFIQNWTWIFHEERYAWPDRYGHPAALATLSELDRTIASPDESERNEYQHIHAWWHRHALRASDSSAVYPDIHFRRQLDNVEISWHARQPEHAPQGFSLTLAPGFALLPVEAVAKPLWDFLDWAISSAPVVTHADAAMVDDLRGRLDGLNKIPLHELELGYLGERVQHLLDQARRASGVVSEHRCSDSVPVITELDSAVLMFGGLNVDIKQDDVDLLLDFMIDQKGKGESAAVEALVGNPTLEAWTLPYDEGYRLADDLRDELGIAPEQGFIDVRRLLHELGIHVVETALQTSSIRGVAIAGNGFAPAILINNASSYNQNESGKRFTLAHELCHILYDRTMAKKLSHMSGPWASARIEKRANAFAAMLLASSSAIRKMLVAISTKEIQALSRKLKIGKTGLIEHLYNLRLIDDAQRDALRSR